MLRPKPYICVPTNFVSCHPQAALNRVGQSDDPDKVDNMLEFVRHELGITGRRISFENFQRLLGQLFAR